MIMNNSVPTIKVLQYTTFKYPWPLTLVLWPWLWKCPWKMSGCINTSFLKMDISSYYHIRLCNLASLTFDLGAMTWTLKFSTCINTSLLKIDIVTHNPIMLCNMACLSIFQLDNWPECCDIDLGILSGPLLKFYSCQPLENQYIVTHYHVQLCNIAC